MDIVGQLPVTRLTIQRQVGRVLSKGVDLLSAGLPINPRRLPREPRLA
jgi:hypothetical protein